MKKYWKKIRKYLGSHWKRTILIVLALGVIFLIVKKATAEPAGILSSDVSRGTLITGFSANGKIKAEKSADLKFNAPAKVTWISVKEGDKVRVWQGIAGLDAVQLDAAYQIAMNNHRNYQATAEEVLDLVKDNDDDESFSQKATRTTAEVARDNAYNSILASRNALNNSIVIAPFAGTVVETSGITAGVNLSGADLETKFIRVVDLTSLYFEANVDEIDYSKVKVGQDVEISVDAFPGQSCQGKVSFIGKDGKETTGGVVTIPVKVTLQKCELDLAANLNGEATFALSQVENTLLISKKYIVDKNGQSFVWKQVGTSTKKRKLVPVKVGNSSVTEAEILEGLSEGDTVIYIP